MRINRYPEIAQERTAARVPGPPSRQPRLHRTVPQGKSRHVTHVQAVDARGWRRREWRVMTEQKLSATDAALITRINELSVLHISCGQQWVYDDGSICPTVDASGRPVRADNRVAVTGYSFGYTSNPSHELAWSQDDQAEDVVEYRDGVPSILAWAGFLGAVLALTTMAWAALGFNDNTSQSGGTPPPSTYVPPPPTTTNDVVPQQHSTPPPPGAVPNAGALNKDSRFLALTRTSNLSVEEGGDSGYLTAAHKVCDEIRAGYTKDQIVRDSLTKSPGVPASDIWYLVNLSVQTYCP